jgi:hypothetical protein
MQKKITIYQKEYWIKKGFSEEEAIKKAEYSKKETSCWCKEYWIKKGFSEEEAKEKIKQKQKQNSQKVNQKNKSNPHKVETWMLRGLSEAEAKEKVNEIKFSQNIYKKFSKDEINNLILKTKKTYYSKSKKERNIINKTRGRTKEELIKTFGENGFLEISKKRGETRRNNFFRRYSKISENFFNDLQQKFKNQLFFADNEKWIRYNKNKGFYVDCLYENKIIEFNGNFYHANPELYESNSIIKMSKEKILTAKEIWKKDEFKLNKLNNLGYEVLVIWEKEIIEDKEKILKKCLKFLCNE